MNDPNDDFLHAQFKLLADDRDDSDWSAVIARAQRARRTRVLMFAAASAVVVVGVASAVALTRHTVSFLGATRAPYSVVANFGSMQVASPPGMAPNVLPHQTRQITTVVSNGRTHILYVAPTKTGGFCFEWTGVDGGCIFTRTDQLTLGGSLSRDRSGAVRMTEIDGSFFQATGTRLEVIYADGTQAQLPFVWVTGPINAGFYLSFLSGTRRDPAHRPVAVSLFNTNNTLIAHATISVPDGILTHIEHLKGFPPLSVPNNVIWSKHRMLFDIPVKGGRYYLWVAPERDGGEAWASNNESGFTQRPQAANHEISTRLRRNRNALFGLAESAQENPGDPVRLCCAVGDHVARVELRFQDGTRVELTPKERFLLAVIPPSHYAPGHRLDELVAYNAANQIIATRAVPTTEPGIYPCAKPKNLGYGDTECP